MAHIVAVVLQLSAKAIMAASSSALNVTHVASFTAIKRYRSNDAKCPFNLRLQNYFKNPKVKTCGRNLTVRAS